MKMVHVTHYASLTFLDHGVALQFRLAIWHVVRLKNRHNSAVIFSIAAGRAVASAGTLLEYLLEVAWCALVDMATPEIVNKSLREICGGLACCKGKLRHLGITAPGRSTLAYANKHRLWTLLSGSTCVMTNNLRT